MSYEQTSTKETEITPFIGGKLAVFDCSQMIDGAVVVVLCSESFMEERGIENKPIIKGFGHRTSPMLFDKKMKDNEEKTFTLP